MIKGLEWTDEEVGRLRRLYTSDVSFEEVLNALPKRTQNAVRIKASRLGLKRPTIVQSNSSSAVLQCVEGDGSSKSYLLRCFGCGSWKQVKGSEYGTIKCGVCGSISLFNP